MVNQLLFITFDNIRLEKCACSRYKVKEKQYMNSREAGGGTGTRCLSLTSRGAVQVLNNYVLGIDQRPVLSRPSTVLLAINLGEP